MKAEGAHCGQRLFHVARLVYIPENAYVMKVLFAMLTTLVVLSSVLATRVVEAESTPLRTPAELESILERNRAEWEMPPIESGDVSASTAYPDIRGEVLHADLETLTEFSLRSRAAGDPIWGRVQGSVFEHQAADWIARQLRSFGIEQTRHDRVPLPPTWQLREAELVLLDAAAGKDLLRLTSATPGWGAPSTPEEGIEAPLVYVGLGTLADLRDRDLTGKIALVHGHAFGGAHHTTGEAAVSRIVRAGGARGVVVIVDQPGNARTLTRNGRDGPRIPNMTVGLLDGSYLRKSIENAPADDPPRLRMQIRAEWVEGLETSAVIAVLPGESDELVLFQAHLDGFWQAVTDNGGGVAAVLGLARHYATEASGASEASERTSAQPAKSRLKRRRGVAFLFTGGHEDGSVGALHFGRNNRALLDRTILVIELEHVASMLVSHSLDGHYQSTTSDAPVGIFVTNQSPLVVKAYRDAAERYDIPLNLNHTPYYWGDIIGLLPSGVDASGWIGSNFFYHSSLDSVEAVRPRSLERITRASAFVADRVDRHTRAELEAGSVPFPMPDASELGDQIHLGYGMPEALQKLLGLGSATW